MWEVAHGTANRLFSLSRSCLSKGIRSALFSLVTTIVFLVWKFSVHLIAPTIWLLRPSYCSRRLTSPTFWLVITISIIVSMSSALLVLLMKITLLSSQSGSKVISVWEFHTPTKSKETIICSPKHNGPVLSTMNDRHPVASIIGWAPHCEDETIKPLIGRTLDTLAEEEEFYTCYAQLAGFCVRRNIKFE